METADAIRRRRAVRKFDTSQTLDCDRVRNCIQLAHLSPSSSNLQLYEMYHITDPTCSICSAGHAYPKVRPLRPEKWWYL